MSQTKSQINYKLNYTPIAIAAHRKTPKMSLVDVNEVDSTANVINKIESKNIDTDLTNILLSIIVFTMSAFILYKAYMFHNKCISKRAINKSQGNDLEKI